MLSSKKKCVKESHVLTGFHIDSFVGNLKIQSFYDLSPNFRHYFQNDPIISILIRGYYL